MAYEVLMPQLGLTMEEGTVSSWVKHEGDAVKAGDVLLEITTDKLTNEVTSEHDGVLLKIVAQEGEDIPVKGLLAYIGQPGEKIPDAPVAVADTPAAAPVETAAETAAPASKLPVLNGSVAATPYAKKLAAEKGVELAAVIASGPAGEVRASDVLAAAQSGAVNATALAKKYAEVNGVDLSAVSGTGHDGKIRKNDVLNAAAPAQREITRIPLTPIRKAIARNMFNSLHSMAQTSDSVEIDVTEQMALRQRLLAHKDELGTKITINDLLSYAAVKMLKTHPLANASFSDTEILCYPDVNLSMAVATDYGLTSPVVHGADRMSLVELSLAMRDLVVRARDRKLTADDQQGGTFTLTNMGIFPVDNFNPILPAPQSCIIGFGRCVEKPAVYQGQICIRTMMVLSVTYDHRVFDGGEVGSIMKTVKEYLETPELFLVQ